MATIRSCLATAGIEGGRLDRINQLAWSYVKELHDYWAFEPPVHILLARVAAAFGVRMPNRPGVLTEFEKLTDAYAAQPSAISAGLRQLGQLPPTVQQWVLQVSGDKNAAN